MLMKAGPERISKNVPGIGGKSFEGTNHIISSLNNAAVPAIEKNSPIKQMMTFAVILKNAFRWRSSGGGNWFS